MSRPHIKPEHMPFRISGGRIRIGGMTYGLAAEINDPDGFVWTLLEGMDGNHSLDEIVALAARMHPGIALEILRQAASQLQDSGYVEDAGAPDPPVLTSRDKERYDRARRYYRWLDLISRVSTWEPQALLAAAKVTVLGVGGNGGVASLALAAAGVGRVHCVDPDVVELSNLSRQVLYAEADIGAPKAEAAVRRLRALNSDIVITGERLRVSSADDAAGLASGCDVLLMAADEPADARIWVNRACIAAGRPWVDVGYYGPLVQASVYVPGEGGCWECLHDNVREPLLELGIVPDDARQVEHLAPRMRSAVGTVPAGISGYLSAHLVIALLTGIPPVRPGTVQVINLAALDAPYTSAGPARPDCPACGGEP